MVEVYEINRDYGVIGAAENRNRGSYSVVGTIGMGLGAVEADVSQPLEINFFVC